MRPTTLAVLLSLLAACDDSKRPTSHASAPTSSSPPSSSSLSSPSPAPSSSSSPAPSSLLPSSSSTSAPGRVEERSFASSSLGVTKKYEVYLPGGYDASQLHYPVITMLHGLGGDETNWLRHGHLAETADALHLQAIVVMPDGDGSFYVDADAARPMDACLADKPPFNGAERPETYCVKTPRYETYITRDLLADVEAHYRVLPGKDARGIGGLSMGGFGALELAMRHPDLYAAAASHSGLASLLYAGPHPYAPGKAVHAESAADWGKKYPDKMRALVRGIFGPSMAFYRDHDPVTLAAHLSPGTLAIYLDCGTEDDFGFEDHAAELHDVLTSRGIDHTFALVPGHHTFDLWRARLPESLRFFSKSLSAPKALP